jgi:CRP-like cAMP-binding protein
VQALQRTCRHAYDLRVEPADLARFLGHLPVFRGLSPAELASLAGGFVARRFAPGDILCNEGDAADGLFVIERGAASVSRRTSSGGMVTLTRLVAPTVVGEMALLDSAPRSATVTADAAIVAFHLGAAHFAKLREANSTAAYKVVRNLSSTLCERLREVNERLDGFFKDPARALRELREWQREQARARGDLP